MSKQAAQKRENVLGNACLAPLNNRSRNPDTHIVPLTANQEIAEPKNSSGSSSDPSEALPLRELIYGRLAARVFQQKIIEPGQSDHIQYILLQVDKPDVLRLPLGQPFCPNHQSKA